MSKFFENFLPSASRKTVKSLMIATVTLSTLALGTVYLFSGPPETTIALKPGGGSSGNGGSGGSCGPKRLIRC